MLLLCIAYFVFSVKGGLSRVSRYLGWGCLPSPLPCSSPPSKVGLGTHREEGDRKCEAVLGGGMGMESLSPTPLGQQKGWEG